MVDLSVSTSSHVRLSTLFGMWLLHIELVNWMKCVSVFGADVLMPYQVTNYFKKFTDRGVVNLHIKIRGFFYRKI